MGRKIKIELSYFPLECKPSESLQYVESLHGIVGFGVVIKLFQHIYSTDGYYCNWSDKKAVIFVKQVGISKGEFVEILSTCFEEGIFHLGMYDEYSILTSGLIQQTYKILLKKMRRKLPEINTMYALSVCDSSDKMSPRVGLFRRNEFRPDHKRHNKGQSSEEKRENLKNENVPNFGSYGSKNGSNALPEGITSENKAITSEETTTPFFKEISTTSSTIENIPPLHYDKGEKKKNKKRKEEGKDLEEDPGDEKEKKVASKKRKILSPFDSAFEASKTIFLAEAISYIWSDQDDGQLRELLLKIRETSVRFESEEGLTESFQLFIQNLPKYWRDKKFTLFHLNRNYNEIINEIQQSRRGGKATRGNSELRDFAKNFGK